MANDPGKTERIAKLISKLLELTTRGELHWERQLGSAHRYARWNNNLLILGPSDPPHASKAPRYLFITPFNSPACVEVNSSDPELGAGVLDLVSAVEKTTAHEPPTDPFAVDGDVLDRLDG